MSELPAPAIDAATMERALLHGDLQKLNSAQHLSYYTAVCNSVGLNPLTRPFDFLMLNGKEVLYARREATEQLRRIDQVSINIVGRELVDGIYVVTARATLPEGRTDENIGAVPLEGLKGDNRANAMMKAETKAKRRVTLAICGLGMLDETEVETIPGTKVRELSIAPALSPAGEMRPASGPERGEIRDSPSINDYATVAPPPDDDGDPPLPDGWVRIARLDSAPTKNPKVTQYFVTTSDGRKYRTINGFLASLAEECVKKRTPVRVKSAETKFGIELKGISTEEEQPLTADDIPF